MTALAVAALLLLAYTYVGYPIAIGVLARLARGRPKSAAGDGARPRVTICMPAYNGADHLPAKIRSLFAQDYPADRLDILVYLDGSTDDSERIARELAASPEAAGRLRVIVAPERKGKPIALNVMGAAATGDLLLLNDVRQPLSLNATAALAAAMADDGVGCATGNLVLAGGAGSGVYWRYENWIRRQESRFRGVVGMTGSIAMMRRSDWSPLPEGLILDDVWIPMKLGLGGKRVAFVEEAEAHDAAFDDDREFRRKVRTLAGNYQLFALHAGAAQPVREPDLVRDHVAQDHAAGRALAARAARRGVRARGDRERVAGDAGAVRRADRVLCGGGGREPPGPPGRRGAHVRGSERRRGGGSVPLPHRPAADHLVTMRDERPPRGCDI